MGRTNTGANNEGIGGTWDRRIGASIREGRRKGHTEGGWEEVHRVERGKEGTVKLRGGSK